MSEIAEVWDETLRTSRKKRYCISGLEISKGEKYWDIRHLCDGQWGRTILHPEFRKIIDKYWGDYEPVCYEQWDEIDQTKEFLNDLLILIRKNGNRAKTGFKLSVSHAWDRMHFQDEIEGLKRERDELRKDKARLDWMERNKVVVVRSWPHDQVAVARWGHCNSGWYNDTRDAIDAAMAKEVSL